MLDRIALHQTRLRTPGLGVDAKGVSLGPKGLVLLPSIDRLVAFLAVYTRERSLEDLLGSLVLRTVRSQLGLSEFVLEVAAESSDRMDRMADTARLVGGFTFTGASRHFVQYRDANAPFGYDVKELLPTDEALALYHDTFAQTYALTGTLDLRALLLRLEPSAHAETLREQQGTAGTPVERTNGSTRPRKEGALRHEDPVWIVAENGLGPALIHYFVRSQVTAEVTVVESPAESAFDEGPVRRFLFRMPHVPSRMKGLLYSTPGLTPYAQVAPGVAVQIGFKHPVSLRACPVFSAAGMVFFRGASKPRVPPFVVETLPLFADVGSLAKVALLEDTSKIRPAQESTGGPPNLTGGTASGGPPNLTGRGAIQTRLPLRVVPSSRPLRHVTASFLGAENLPLFRKLAYALSPNTLRGTTVAVTAQGTFLRNANGIEGIPLGWMFVEVYPRLYLAAGHDFLPAVAPEVLFRALELPSTAVAFLTATGKLVAIDEAGFCPLETELLEAPTWEAWMVEPMERALTELPIELEQGSLGFFPLSGLPKPGETSDA